MYYQNDTSAGERTTIGRIRVKQSSAMPMDITQVGMSVAGHDTGMSVAQTRVWNSNMQSNIHCAEFVVCRGERGTMGHGAPWVTGVFSNTIQRRQMFPMYEMFAYVRHDPVLS